MILELAIVAGTCMEKKVYCRCSPVMQTVSLMASCSLSAKISRLLISWPCCFAWQPCNTSHRTSEGCAKKSSKKEHNDHCDPQERDLLTWQTCRASAPTIAGSRTLLLPGCCSLEAGCRSAAEQAVLSQAAASSVSRASSSSAF